MSPRLVAIAGPLKAAIIPLDEAEVSVGRTPSNHLMVDDKSISRQHCLIKREGAEFRLTDLESHNGTFVNDLPVRERVLNHGDRIRIGTSLFLFMLYEAEPPSVSNSIQLTDEGFITKSATKVRLEDALYQMARDLNILMRIGRAISSIRQLEALQHKLLELILEVIPAERGALILLEDSLEKPQAVCALDKINGPEQPVQVSRTVSEQVLNEGVAILCNEVAAHDDLGSAESLAGFNINSVLCVPLNSNKLHGIIYLDTSDAAIRFDESHLQLLTAISGIGAVALENAGHVQWLEGEYHRLLQDVQVEHNMVGDGARMRLVHRLIARVAPTDSNVLILGESGTGKELAAWAIHQNSSRAGKPFIAVNCAALTESLLESELFGHEKGAFTGAVARKKGKLEIAHQGTVFLDEVGELAPALQSKLLRVLQTREFERVGGTQSIKSDFRLIAATNRNLEEAVKAGDFRQDLYYRLNVVSVTMPPLRERREDIELLVNYFIVKYSEKCNRKISGMSDKARKLLNNYDWPGNIRELENCIERAVVFSSTEILTPDDLPEHLLEAESFAEAETPGPSFYEAVREAKRKIILDTLEKTNGNFVEAAAMLGIHSNNLHRLIRSLNLKPVIKRS